MKQKSTSMIAVLSVVFLGLLTGVTGQVLGQSGRVVSKFGQAQVEGRDVIVHVTVVVSSGANANQVALDAIRNQGARPFQGNEFSTSGLVWDQFSDSYTWNDMVTQNYNPANDPTGDGLGALLNTHLEWSGVSTSEFAFAPGELTNRCPSLVKECEGKQTFDGFNDVAWLGIRGCCTLAVTWFSTSIDEADMAINTKFSWSTDGINDFDLESVILHENGHVVGLGHSEVEDAVMYQYYIEPRQWLHDDDIEGITSLYPVDGTTAPDETPAGDTTAPVISKVSSKKSGKGGTFKITWKTDEPADSEVTFTCCGTFTNSELVTDHSMGFRAQKNVTYEYSVSSTDDAGNKATEGPFSHVN